GRWRMEGLSVDRARPTLHRRMRRNRVRVALWTVRWLAPRHLFRSMHSAGVAPRLVDVTRKLVGGLEERDARFHARWICVPTSNRALGTAGRSRDLLSVRGRAKRR